MSALSSFIPLLNIFPLFQYVVPMGNGAQVEGSLQHVECTVLLTLVRTINPECVLLQSTELTNVQRICQSFAALRERRAKLGQRYSDGDNGAGISCLFKAGPLFILASGQALNIAVRMAPSLRYSFNAQIVIMICVGVSFADDLNQDFHRPRNKNHP